MQESWESLTPELDTLLEIKCDHQGTTCTPCKLQRRIPIYGLLWADFVGPSASENTEHLQLTQMVLENILMIMDARIWIMAARSGDAAVGGPCPLGPVGDGDVDVLVHLEKL